MQTELLQASALPLRCCWHQRRAHRRCAVPPTPPVLQERRQHEEELEANNGVFYRATLTAVPAPESIAADKGIRRAADKVRVPSCLRAWDPGRLPGTLRRCNAPCCTSR